jgi:hypothetical protein
MKVELKEYLMVLAGINPSLTICETSFKQMCEVEARAGCAQTSISVRADYVEKFKKFVEQTGLTAAEYRFFGNITFIVAWGKLRDPLMHPVAKYRLGFDGKFTLVPRQNT